MLYATQQARVNGEKSESEKELERLHMIMFNRLDCSPQEAVYLEIFRKLSIIEKDIRHLKENK